MYRLVLLTDLDFWGVLLVLFCLSFLSLNVSPALCLSYVECHLRVYVSPHRYVIYSHRSGMSHITFTTWNCRGMGRALKRSKFLHLKSLSSDIVFLPYPTFRAEAFKICAGVSGIPVHLFLQGEGSCPSCSQNHPICFQIADY